MLIGNFLKRTSTTVGRIVTARWFVPTVLGILVLVYVWYLALDWWQTYKNCENFLTFCSDADRQRYQKKMLELLQF